MTKQQYDSLTPYQREVYDKWNKGNKRGLFAGWILEAIVTIIVMALGISTVISKGEGFKIIEVFQNIFFGALIGGIFTGSVHLNFLFKKCNLGFLNLIAYLLIVAVIFYGGWVFLIVDTILFIMRKPLIYRWEDKRVLAKAAEQEGVPFRVAPSASNQLNELNQMLNNGLITQEEFDTKKAEIMSRL